MGVAGQPLVNLTHQNAERREDRCLTQGTAAVSSAAPGLSSTAQQHSGGHQSISSGLWGGERGEPTCGGEAEPAFAAGGIASCALGEVLGELIPDTLAAGWQHRQVDFWPDRVGFSMVDAETTLRVETSMERADSGGVGEPTVKSNPRQRKTPKVSPLPVLLLDRSPSRLLCKSKL